MKLSSETSARIVSYVILAVALVFALGPIVWMVRLSLQSRPDILMDPPQIVPGPLTLENYQAVVENADVLVGIRNGFIIACATTLISLALGSLAAWGISQYRFRGSDKVLIGIMSTLMLPLVVLLIPLYKLFTTFKLIDNVAALAVVYCALSLPFVIWMAKGFFDTIPHEVIEAAAIDGVSRIGTFFRIGLPLTRTGLVATGVFSFLLAWDEYVLAITLIQSQEYRTMPPSLILTFVGQFAYQWGPMMAAGVLVSAPVLVIFMIFQKYIVAGLTAGAVKG
jgi:multiple sugar transport system permease protein